MKKRIWTLDIVKVILALLIVLHHYQQMLLVSFSSIKFYGGAVDFGFLVEMFFIISGFLLMQSMAGKNLPDFKKFFLHKIIRVWPVAAISVLVTAVISFVYFLKTGAYFYEIPVTIWNVFLSTFLMFGGNPFSVWPGINNPLWYVCVLMICFAIAYFILWLSNNHQISPVYGFIIMVIIGQGSLEYGINLPMLNTLTTSRGYSSFFLGMLIFYIWKYISKKKILFVSIVALVLEVAMTAFDKTSLSMYQRNTFTFILFPAVMFIMLFVAEKLSVQSKAISHIGGISYEIYIWHFPAIILLDLIRRMNGMDVSNPLFVTGFVAVVVVFAAVLYFAVELPLTKHLKKAYENQ